MVVGWRPKLVRCLFRNSRTCTVKNVAQTPIPRGKPVKKEPKTAQGAPILASCSHLHA